MNLLDSLRTHRLLAIVRGSDPDAALATVLTLADSGINLIEVSLTSTDALGVLRRARAALGTEYGLGAGTVLTAEQAADAAEAGATYLVTPALAPSLAEAARLGLPVLAGALTPTEVVQATTGGAAAVKLFPASVGGPDYLRALRDPFPQTPFVPVGGVDAARARDYLDRGAIAVGVGSPLVGDAVRGGDLAALRQRAADFLAVTAIAPAGGAS
ncbi:bifunctional 4-hydroxy-2-oxoglutarate aldolase/2-dehydro-3-deoxy-phosphogluconate aldolase [Micromonospora sp. NBC_01796]|uniref:bifunctional 4-hydroxy-2-oxoglutarate aldolase/2-dehydro-3-deoxy-phosphogluconate aldolase n=1 Tax=Micromonospora sp. NBC_01796 TaxID=2975987 RepID=UPI002DD98C9A|nr:bifunctional 4-hydroxy-2-oxoglutarate aldolase/2-dehydro-3-deoxy-phosphogluconate aldolase [Micromonospora sp. NBC_01796]WSA85503.1 bifunctional 4-hydroxy-2-oxoglutarate aldolase/2-dehydro-3-deoxy-phosphogluconate aldolase [Micromonospora sp. NBC_01796]